MTSLNQRRMQRQVNGRMADRLQKRWMRRLLVVAAILGAAGAASGLALFNGNFAVLIAAGVPFGVSAVLLNMSLRGIFELSNEQLDEFQTGLRNRAYKNAYGVGLIFLLVVATVLAGLQLDRTLNFSIAAFAFITSALLPRLIVAWQLEDSDGDE